jgi:hypothetical protein
MITKIYNPSPLETKLAKIIFNLKDEINSQIEDSTIESIEVNGDQDNPDLLLKLQDSDGDKHELVIKIIQRPDSHL